MFRSPFVERLALSVCAVILLAEYAAGAQLTANWTGLGGDNNYSNPANWDLGGVDIPINDLTNTYIVNIPAGTPINFDVAGVGLSIDRLSLSAGRQLDINSGRSLTVLDTATISGVVTTSNSTFLANHASTTFGGNAARATVANGGSTTIAAVTYSSAGINTSATLFESTGAGSTLDLSQLQTFNANHSTFGGVQVHTVRAANSGVIDLSNLQQVTAPQQETNDRLDFTIETAGNIDLSSLQSTSGTGIVQFNVNVNGYSLPSLLTPNRSQFVVSNGNTLNLGTAGNPATHAGGGYTINDNAVVNFEALTTLNNATVTLGDNAEFNAINLTNFDGSIVNLSPNRTFNVGSLNSIDNARISVSGGVSFNNVTTTSYSSAGINASATLFSADGGGSSLDLSSIESIAANHATFGGLQVHTVSATNGGVIDLSSVESLLAPQQEATDRIDFVIGAGSNVDLSALQTTGGTGIVRFQVDRAAYSLPALVTPNRAQFDVANSSTLTLGDGVTPASQNGGAYNLANDAVVDFDTLTTLNNAVVSLGAGAQFNAPALTDFSGSTVALQPGRTFNTGSLGNIDNAKISVAGGTTWGVSTGDLSAVSYSSAATNASATLFSADGGGSSLDLSSIESIAANHATFGGLQVHTVTATNGGVIDLSSVESILAPQQETNDRIDFIIGAASNIDLYSLQSTGGTGIVRFQVDRVAYSLPALVTPNRAQFDVANSSTLTLGDGVSAATQTGGTYNLADDATINFLGLVTANSVTFNLGNNAEFNAPNLTNFDGSVVTLAPGRTFNTGTLSTLNNARILMSGGVNFADVSATSYSSAGINASATLFSADGPGTTLDLSTLTSFAANHATFGGVQVHTVIATNSALIDLSGVTTITSPAQEANDRLDFIAQTSAVIDLSSLSTVSGVGETRFTASDGGTLKFGDLLITDDVNLTVTGNTSKVEVGGGLHIDNNAALNIVAGATVQVQGNFSHDLTDEAAFDGDTGIIQMWGDGNRLFEVAGTDLGDIAATDNFGLVQLIVGSDTTTTNLILVDLIDNGNRASPEALYLLGSGGLDGLTLLNGSSLTIGNIPVYAAIDGGIVELHTLFPEGETIIPYTEPGSDGFLILPEPSAGLLLAMGGLAMLRRRI